MEPENIVTGRPAPLLYSREVPRLDPTASLDAVVDPELVENVLHLIEQNAPIENALFHHDPFGLLARAVAFVALVHENCGMDPRHPSYFKCQVPDPFENFAPADVLRDFGSRSELFFDTLSVYLQWFPSSDHSAWYGQQGGTPEFDDAQRGARFHDALAALLSPRYTVTQNGLVLPVELAGSAPMIESPAIHLLRGAQWPDVISKVEDAEREILDGHFADSVTDSGTALEVALARVGCDGKTLGERVKVAKHRLFTNTETQLGEAAERIAKYVASMRNIKGDAHAGADASRSDAELVLRTTLALMMWLAEVPRQVQPD